MKKIYLICAVIACGLMACSKGQKANDEGQTAVETEEEVTSQEAYDQESSDGGYAEDSYSDYADEPADDYESAADDPRAFHHAQDVITYLMGAEFEGESEGSKVTLRFRPEGLFANGTQLTGAIEVESFDEVSAVVSCTSPYNGATMVFKIVQGMLAKEMHSGEIYYAK